MELEQCASSGAGVAGAVSDPSVRVGALSVGAESIAFGDPYVMEQWTLLVSKPASVVGVEALLKRRGAINFVIEVVCANGFTSMLEQGARWCWSRG